MLRRAPTTSDGKVVDRLKESNRINQPFKSPFVTPPVERVQPARKRKRTSYKDQQGEESEDDDSAPKKKKKKEFGEYAKEDELKAAIQKFPVFKPKPFNQVRAFSMPSMTNKKGESMSFALSNVSLGLRPQAKLLPRPLHDPMQDHAIVLYDPTIDERETDEERRERIKEEEKQKAEEEARAKTAGMFNPHKSLKSLLGESKEKTKSDKIPVVIDPLLTKVLRPHQIEGVKV